MGKKGTALVLWLEWKIKLQNHFYTYKLMFLCALSKKGYIESRCEPLKLIDRVTLLSITPWRHTARHFRSTVSISLVWNHPPSFSLPPPLLASHIQTRMSFPFSPVSILLRSCRHVRSRWPDNLYRCSRTARILDKCWSLCRARVISNGYISLIVIPTDRYALMCQPVIMRIRKHARKLVFLCL